MITEDWKRELTEIFFGRLSIIIVTSAAIFAFSAAVAFFWPPTYEAVGTILMRSKEPGFSPEALERAQLENLPSKEDLATELEIIVSPALIQRTILRTREDPNAEKTDTDSAEFLKAMREVKDSISASVIPSTKVIRIALRDKNDVKAQETLNALLDEYIYYRGAIFNPGEKKAFLEERTNLYRDELDKQKDQLIADARATSITLSGVEREMANNLDLKAEMIKRLNATNSTLVEIRRQIEPLDEALKSDEVQFFSFLEVEVLRPLAVQLVEVMGERENAMRQFLPGSPKIQSIDSHITLAYKALRDEAVKILRSRQAEVAGLEAKAENINKQIHDLEAKNVELQRYLLKYMKMREDTQLTQLSYEAFFMRSEKAQVEEEVSGSNFSAYVNILSRPSIVEVVFPKKSVTLFLGLLIGFVAGCSLGFVLEFFDHSFKNPNDVSRYMELPVIFSIKRL